MEQQVKGGFPRIYVKINKIEQKQEQGFVNKSTSIKSIMTYNNSKKISIGSNNDVNVVSINNTMYGGSLNKKKKKEKHINGIPLSMIID